MVWWKNVMWLNQTWSPVSGWIRIGSRTAVVRRPPSPIHSVFRPLRAQCASTSLRLSVSKTCCQATPKSSWKLRTTIHLRRANSSRTAGSIASYTLRMSASGVAPWVSGSMSQ